MNRDHPCVLSQKLTDHHVSVSITGLLLTSYLFARHGLCPILRSHIDTEGGSNFITVRDVQSAYWQIPIAKKDCHKTAFVTLKGKYVFKVFPFGIANAPWIFQRVMPLAFANFGLPSGLLVYMDDVIACSATWEAHLKFLEGMFRALQTTGLTLKPSKIHFGPKEVQHLGHISSANGIRMGEVQI